MMDYDDPVNQMIMSEQYTREQNKDSSVFSLSENANNELQSAIKNAAIALLAQREQSKKELRVKLQRKFAQKSLIDAVIDDLSSAGLQSDERFVETFLRAKKSAGKGPVLIKHELKEKGVSEYLIAAYIYENDDEWFELAEQVYEKKFGASGIQDAKDKGKRLRFMASRGFTASIVYDLMEQKIS